MLGISSSLVKGGASLLTFVKDNLKLYLDFNSKKSDTLKFPSEGSTFFNGSSDYITVSDSNSLSIAGSVTFSAWVKPTDLNSTITILSKTHTSNLGFNFQIASNDTFYFRINDGSNNYSVYSTATLTLGKWHHLCVSWNQNDGRAKFYLDGVESGRSSNSAVTGMGSPDNTVDLTIGRRSDGFSAEYYKGKLSNVAMWSRDLSQEEVQSIMNKSYSQLKGVETTSLISWWGLDNDTVMQSNVSTFLDNTTGADGTWDNSGGVMTISSDRYRYFNHFIPSAVSDTSKKMKFTITAKKTGSGSVSLWFKGNTIDTFPLTNNYQTFTINMYNQTVGDNFVKFTGASGSNQVIVTKFDAQYYGSYDSHGSNNGNNNYVAPVFTESLSSDGLTYGSISQLGGNAPILPRAVDVAKEGQADAIGNGSLTTSSGGYADLGNDSLIQFGGSFSVSCWFKTTDTTTTNEMVIAKADDGVSAGWLIRLNSSRKLDFSYLHNASGGSGVVISDTGSAVNDGEWYHVAFVHESGVGNRAYKNGILIGSNSTGTDLGSHTPNLHVGNQDYVTARALDGSFAQVGLWQGALTQAQIQSIMESTSYSKIPADVKSTTTEKLPSPDLTSGTGLTISQGSTGTLTHDTTAGTITAINDVQDGYLRWYSAGLEENKLYKLEIVVDSYTGGRFRTTLGWNGTNFYPTVGTNIQYFIGSSTASFGIRIDDGNPAEFVISKISVQEVTNDLVSYYGLDSLLGVKITPEETNQTLGSELVTNGNLSNGTTGFYDHNNSTFEVLNGELHAITSNAIFEGVRYNIGNYTESGRFYKIEFDYRVVGNAMYFYVFNNDTGASTSADNNSTATIVLNATSTTRATIYWKCTGANARLSWVNGGNASREIFIDNVSVKEFGNNANHGVLK